MNRISVLVLCAAALLVPALGGAQQQSVSYPLTISAVPYRALPLDGGTATPMTLSGTDDGANGFVDLPFPVVFYGNSYNRLKATADGYVEFGSTSTGTVFTNRSIPRTETPNAAVFLWHDDNATVDGNSMRTQVLGTTPNRQLVIEWNVKRLSTTFNFAMQLWLTENSPAIRVHYGPTSGGGSNITATMGIENADGTQGVRGILPSGVDCNPTGDQNGNFGCNETQFPSGYLYMYGATPEPDVVPSVTLGAVAEVNNQLNIPLTTTVQNHGLVPAVGVTWNYYFSNDATLDGNDAFMASYERTETIPPTSSESFPDALTWPVPTTAGQYRVCVWVDPDGLITDEINRANNKACSTNAIVLGADPSAVSAEFVDITSATPGQTASIKYVMKNLGTRTAQNFEYALKVAKARNQAGAEVVYTGTATLAPGESREATVQVRLPTQLVADQLFPFLHINPDGKFVEANTNNNVVFGTKSVSLLNPDIQPKSVQVVGGEGCFFGRESTISYEVCNNGKSTALNFVDAIFMNEGNQTAVDFTKMIPAHAIPNFCSTNADCSDAQQGVCIEGTLGGASVGTCHYGCTADADCAQGLSCVVDPDLNGQKSCQNVYVANRCVTHQRSVLVPSVDNAGEPLVEGREYMFTVVLDPTEKLNEGESVDKVLNNVARSPRLSCRYPAPNFFAASLIAPPRIAAGETVALSREIENVGNEAATVAYRYVLSTNETFSDKDLRLPLVTTQGDGKLTLEPKKASRATELVLVPGHVAPGEYFLGLVVDPDRSLHELDKNDNTIASLGKVVVERSSLQVRTPVLPTGTVGAWYGFQLLAAGGASEYVWSAHSLPAGVELSRGGYLSGRLSDEGRFPFTVQVRSGEAVQEATLILDVRRPTGPLVINTAELPVAYTYSTSRWDARISIAGGTPPYACTFQGTPARFYQNATDSCALYANDGLERAGEYDFSVTVTDAAGVSVRGPLHLSVRDSDLLAFKEHRFVEEGLVGQRFQACVESAPNRHVGREPAVEVLYGWSMGDAPAGMATVVPNPDAPGKACLDGVPTECGTFLVKVRVETRLEEDGAIDQWAEALMPLVVQCRQLMLESDVVPSVFRGDNLDVQLRVNGPHADEATFRLAAGTLPEGIGLDANGRLHGIVGAQAAYGAHNVVLELRDGQGGFGYAGLTVFVEPTPVEKPKPAAEKSSGCSAAGGEAGAGGLMPFGIALAGLLGLGARRKVVAPVADGVAQRRRFRR